MAVVTGILVFLALGILSDILIAAYTLFVGKAYRFPASLTSVVVSFLNLLVIVNIFAVTPTIINIAAWAVGNGVGTFILMSISKYLKKRLDKNAKQTTSV